MIKVGSKWFLGLCLAGLFLTWTTTPLSAAWQTPKTPEDYNYRGLEKQSRGDLDDAIADYTAGLALKGSGMVKEPWLITLKQLNSIRRMRWRMQIEEWLRSC